MEAQKRGRAHYPFALRTYQEIEPLARSTLHESRGLTHIPGDKREAFEEVIVDLSFCMYLVSRGHLDTSTPTAMCHAFQQPARVQNPEPPSSLFEVFTQKVSLATGAPAGAARSILVSYITDLHGALKAPIKS